MQTLKEIKYGNLVLLARDGTNDEGILHGEAIEECYHFPHGMKVAVDIGAHVGGSALICASMGAKVYAYEPNTENYEVFKLAIARNKMEDSVIPFKQAVGVPGKMTILNNTINYGNIGAYIENKGQSTEEVDVISLEEVFMRNKIEYCDLLKLDCEGGEYDTLLTADENIFKKIKQISVELHYARNMEKPPELVRKYGEEYAKNLAALLNRHYNDISITVSPSNTAYLLICKNK